MSENTRSLIMVICSILQIVGLLFVGLPLFCRLPEYFRILIGICGAASIVKFWVLPEKDALSFIASFAGMGLILFAYFVPFRSK